MRAWRLAIAGDATPLGWRVEESAIDEPELPGDSVLVAVEACVIGAPERFTTGAHIPGGAAVGTVVRAGDEAGHLLDRRVVLGPEQACGECDVCRRGKPVMCPHGRILGRTCAGTLASFVAVRARWVCALDGDLACPALRSPAAALLGREGAWAYTMFARAGVAPGEPVFVVGGDVVARMLIEIAIARGARPMVVHEPAHTGFADWLTDLGATSVPIASTARDDEVRIVADEAAGAGGYGQRPRYVFETSALAHTRATALALCGPGARLTWLSVRALGLRAEPAVAARPDAIDTILDLDATLVGVAGAHPDLLPELAALVVRGELDIESAARVVSLDQISDMSDETEPDPSRGLVATLPPA